MTSEILRREFGITLQDNRANATLSAFQDPVAAFDKYRDAREVVVTKAATNYAESLKAAQIAGLPVEAAIEYAKKRSIAFYQDEMELLNLSHPYAETPEGLISLATGVKRRDLLEKYKGPKPVEVPKSTSTEAS